ncbi:MAG: hypothetical protein ACOVP4_03405 [Bacteriovoracaceae bacterium]|jgi:hypothetical protein
MKKLIFCFLALLSYSVFAQDIGFNFGRSSEVVMSINKEIGRNQLEIKKILRDELNFLEESNADQFLKCGRITGYSTSVYGYKSKCRNGLTKKKIVTLFVDLKDGQLIFEVKTAPRQKIKIPESFRSDD